MPSVSPASRPAQPADPWAASDGFTWELGRDRADPTDYSPSDGPSEADRAEWAALSNADDGIHFPDPPAADSGAGIRFLDDEDSGADGIRFLDEVDDELAVAAEESELADRIERVAPC